MSSHSLHSADPLGVQGKKLSKFDNLEVWAGPLSNNRVVVVLWNKSDSRAVITTKWEDIGLNPKEEVKVRSLSKHTNMAGIHKANLTASMKPHVVKDVYLDNN